MTHKEVIAQLLKEGAKQVKDVIVKNVTVTPQDEWVKLGLTLDKEVDGYRANEDGTYEPAKTRVIFVSAYSIGAILKEDDDAAFAANHLIKHPDAMGMILRDPRIIIVQETVVSGTDYKNPFASENSEGKLFTHDAIINHIDTISLSDFGLKRLDRLADMMMGF